MENRVYYNDKRCAESGLSDWMGQLDGGIKLKNIIMPGTHQSASFTITSCCDCLGICQFSSIRGQLDAGVRFMDIRVGSWNQDCAGEVYYGHGPLLRGGRFPEPFEDLTDWLKEHPNELVIIELKTSGNAKPSEDQMKLFIELAEEHLKPFAMDPQDDITEVTLGEARNGQNLIVIWKMDSPPEFAWNRTAVNSPWHNADLWEDLKVAIEEDINTRDPEVPQLHSTQNEYGSSHRWTGSWGAVLKYADSVAVGTVDEMKLRDYELSIASVTVLSD